jgi:O-phospho-L-seryl-tRNASec:L-selenocysteinyl-tRNA synthase
MTKNLLHSIGMTLSFLTLRILKPNAKYIIWSRIDQKTCFKCIITSGFIPIIIDPIIKKNTENNNNNNYELITNIEKITTKINELGKENILCIFSTTSCFAPRNYDDIESLSLICKENNIFHVVNNAYGIQCTKIVDYFK